jgi:Tol biopolymer transport system component
MGRNRGPVALALVMLSLAAALGGAAAGAGGTDPTTTLVSSLHGKGGNGNSLEPSISADGRYVAFTSRATNLSPAAKSGKRQIFVRDLKTGTVTLASRANGPDGAVADQISLEPSISADGRFVAFTSLGENLSPEDGTSRDVFVRDLVAGTTTLVSRASGITGAAGDGEAYEPSISADGRHVAFTSSSTNLGSEGTRVSGQRDVILRDLDSGVTELISRLSGATGATASGYSDEPSISADGHLVAFVSTAPISSEDVDEESFPEDVFVRDRTTATTLLVSRASGATAAPSNVESSEPAVSADGLHVAFASSAKLTGQRFYSPNVFLRDLATATTALVSVGEEGRAGDWRRRPSISANGRFVAFETRGNKLSPADADGRTDVFARDMVKGLTVTVSRASGELGVPGNGPSTGGSISADGSLVAFDSRATNFSGADEDRFADVFLRRVVYAKEKVPPRCAGRVATLIGTPRGDVLKGTKRKDVIIALGGADHIKSYSQGDVICGGAGRDEIDAGNNGEGGSFDLVRGGPGADHIVLGPELGKAFGDGGNDLLIGSKGGDNLFGGPGNDVLYGKGNPVYNTDFLYGGPGNDRLYGGPSSNNLNGGPGRDVEVGDNRD